MPAARAAARASYGAFGGRTVPIAQEKELVMPCGFPARTGCLTDRNVLDQSRVNLHLRNSLLFVRRDMSALLSKNASSEPARAAP